MICQHCGKPVSFFVSEKAKAKILKLKKEGYSVRDIETLIKADGEQISFSTVDRFLRQNKIGSPGTTTKEK